MRPRLAAFFLFAPLVLAGCNRQGDSKSEASTATEAGAGNYCRLGPIGLSVESARLGKIRMRGMMGQDGESDREVFTLKTRFKLFDTGTPVKQPVIQRDGMLIMGAAGVTLKDESGRQFNPVGGFGLNAATSRRTQDAVLTAEKPEVTDLLTFESTIGAAGDLILSVKGDWQVQQPDGKFLQPAETGTFRIRIPRAMWETEPPATEAGPGNWATVGPLSVAIESVRLGKVRIRSGLRANQEGESAENMLVITTRIKLADPAAHIQKPPFISDGFAMLNSPAVTLKARHGEAFQAVTASGFDQIVGRQSKDVELTAASPEATDLLTFTEKAASADELILTLWPKWKEKKPDGTWADGPLDGEFRFRIPKSMWVKEK